MNITPLLPVGARLRLVQDTVAVVEIPNNVGNVPNLPNLRQRSTFDPIVDGVFVAPQAGFYRFNTAAEINGSGMLDVIIEDCAADQIYFGRGRGEQDVTAQLSVTLYLEADQSVRRMLSYYADAPAPLFPRAASNFLEIEYGGL